MFSNINKKKFPHYFQTDSKNCGDTCIRIITKYYGRFLSTADIEKLSRANNDGVSFLNLSTTAKDLGLRTLEAKIDFETLSKEAVLPCIVHWDKNHFVVVYKINKKNIYISDPAKGLVKYDKNTFIDRWRYKNSEPKGFVMFLEPTPNFYEIDSKKKKISLKYILSYFYIYRSFFYQIIVSLIILTLFQFISPFLTQSLIDIGIMNSNLNFIYLIIIIQAFLFLSQLSVNFIQSWIFLHLTTRINISLVSDFFINLMNLPLSFFDKKLTGDILQRIGDNYRLQSFLTGPTLNTFFSFFNLIVFSFVMLIYSKLIFFIFLISSILYVIWVFLFLKKRREYDYLNFEQSGKEKSKIIEIINGIHEIKLYNIEDQKRWAWERVKVNLFRIGSKMLVLGQLQSFGAGIINRGSSLIISFYTAKLVIEGNLTLGMLFAITFILGQLRAPINNFIGFVNSYQDAKISIERLNELNDENKDKTINENSSITLPSNEDLIIKNVAFSYNNSSEKVLKDLNLLIESGKITAFVGLSGSGKTSLMKLLLKFYSNYEGKISYGDLDLNKIDQKTWNKKCAFVFQDGYIFNDTILENIIMSDINYDINDVRKALKLACIDDFVLSLDEGINTEIGNEGLGLSAGQKQRILIARAIYKNTEINFFDEATSVLDAVNEKNIMENLSTILKNKTSIIIAHRISTIKNADKIVVFNSGKIQEIGKHDELIEAKGEYYSLVKNQIEILNV